MPSMKKILTLALMAVSTPAFAATLTGAGASFPFPLYSKMFAEYAKGSDNTVNYQSVGSGAGQNQLLSQTVDFAGTDVPIPAENVSKYPGKVLTIPTALGAVVPSYNIPGVDATLKFTGKVLADIYLGKIKTWNDAAITKLNPDVRLPPLPITVVRRSDGSGTTGVFTDYLSKVSGEWKSKVGSATSVSWPVGIGARGNDGVAGAVKSTPGSIGYIELTYALQNKIDFGTVQNRAGKFVKASKAGVNAAAATTVLPASGYVSITNAPGESSYPISTFTYVIFYAEQKYGNRTEAQARALKDALNYVVTKGQQFNEALDYVELPSNAATRARSILSSMTFGGKPVR